MAQARAKGTQPDRLRISWKAALRAGFVAALVVLLFRAIVGWAGGDAGATWVDVVSAALVAGSLAVALGGGVQTASRNLALWLPGGALGGLLGVGTFVLFKEFVF